MDYQWAHRPMEVAIRVTGISVVVTCFGLLVCPTHLDWGWWFT